jgi:hypothetical protein
VISALSRDELPPPGLLDWREVLGEGMAVGRAVKRRRTAFHRLRGVASQHDWALGRRAAGRSLFMVNIGMPDWTLTKAALHEIWFRLEEAGLTPPDSYDPILERRMGLPAKMRETAPQETEPALWTESDWIELRPDSADPAPGPPHRLAREFR